VEPALAVLGDVVRNRHLRRLVPAFAAFVLTEYAVWIAILVYAYGHGGATTAGLVALAQLVPAAVTAPLAAPLADRRSPSVVLCGSYVVQGVAYGATATLIFVGSTPLLVYLGAILASTAVSTVRPAQAVLVPALIREVKELTATNALVGWVESLSILLAGAVVGLALTFGGVGYVCALCAGLLGGAAILVAPLGAAAPRDLTVSTGTLTRVGDGFVEVWRSPPARLLVGLLGAEFIVIGALDVLFVVMAFDVLHSGQAWAGYLNMAYGAGGVVLGGMGVLLIGRRLGPVIMATAALLGLALAATALSSSPLLVASLLTVVGGGRALFDLGTRALLQRAVPADMVGRIFGLAEGLTMAGCAAGSMLVPGLVSLGGARLALVGVAVVLPLLVMARAAVLWRIDQHARVPIVEISLLRTLPLFRALPLQALEGLAQALDRVEFEPGVAIVREGDLGDRYYVIVDGHVEILQGDRTISTLGRGDGLGEIALLRDGRRTASAVAAGPVIAFTLDRQSFLLAVNGHVPTSQMVTQAVRDVQARDAERAAET
jgi:MFS family permease